MQLLVVDEHSFDVEEDSLIDNNQPLMLDFSEHQKDSRTSKRSKKFAKKHSKHSRWDGDDYD
jgi:hypothetical protein